MFEFLTLHMFLSQLGIIKETKYSTIEEGTKKVATFYIHTIVGKYLRLLTALNLRHIQTYLFVHGNTREINKTFTK